MKKFFAVLFLVLCSTFLIYGQKPRLGQTPQKPNPVDYPIKVHISASRIVYYCNGDAGCRPDLHADAILNAKKFDLTGTTTLDRHNPVLLIPGDYPARLTKDPQTGNSALIYQEYDVLLPDGTVWHCVTTGISE